LRLILVCKSPPAAHLHSTTTPSDITGQFLAGDTIVYSCNGDLIPDAPTTLTCTDHADQGTNLAIWLPDLSLAPIPECSKKSVKLTSWCHSRD